MTRRIIICTECRLLVQEYRYGRCSWCWWLAKHGYRDGRAYCKAIFPDHVAAGVVEMSH